MKKLPLIVGAITLTVVVVGAGVLSVRHYNKYQTKQAHQSQLQAEAEAKKANELTAKAEAVKARVQQQYTAVRLECERGHDYYAKLPVYVRKTVQAPNCGPSVIE